MINREFRCPYCHADVSEIVETEAVGTAQAMMNDEKDFDEQEKEHKRLRGEISLLVKTLEYPEHKHAFENLRLARELTQCQEQLREAQTQIAEFSVQNIVAERMLFKNRAESAEAKNLELAAQLIESENQRGEAILRNAEIKNRNTKLTAQVVVIVKRLQEIEQRAANNLDDRETVHSVHGMAREALLANLPAEAEKLMRLVEAVKGHYDWHKEHSPATTCAICKAYRDLRGGE